MRRIASAGNTDVPAYLAILERGYSVSSIISNGQSETWRAERDGIELIAETPLSLLGLVAMLDQRGRDWKATDPEIEDFVKKFCSR